MRNPNSFRASASKTTPCCSKVGIKRGPWTPEEDELLANYIRKEGEGRWRTLPKRAGLIRCGKSCRLRWMNYLRPSVKRGQIAPDEEDLILRLHRLLGNRWSLIAGRIPGRTDNEIKNYWNTHLSKKLINQGIDPRTHKPLYPNPSSSPEFSHDPASTSNPNPNPKFSGLEETGRPYRNITIKSGENLKFAKLDQYPPIPTVLDNSNENWQNSDGSMMGFQSGHGNNNREDDISYCNEETFMISSFLNSFINEDVFENQQLQLPNGIAPSSDSMVSSVQNFNNGTVWGDGLTSTMVDLGDEQNALNQMA